MILQITHTDYYEPRNMVIVKPANEAAFIVGDMLIDDCGRKYEYTSVVFERGQRPIFPHSLCLKPMYHYRGESIATLRRV